MEITEQKAQSLQMKMRSVERSNSYLRLTARLPERASLLEGLNCSKWSYSEYKRQYNSKPSADHSSSEQCILLSILLRNRYLANERCDAPCKCCLSIFTNVKVLIINRDSSSGVFCRCEPPTLFSQDPTYDRQFLQRKCLKLKISGCLLLLSSKISTIKAVLLQ